MSPSQGVQAVLPHACHYMLPTPSLGYGGVLTGVCCVCGATREHHDPDYREPGGKSFWHKHSSGDKPSEWTATEKRGKQS